MTTKRALRLIDCHRLRYVSTPAPGIAQKKHMLEALLKLRRGQPTELLSFARGQYPSLSRVQVVVGSAPVDGQANKELVNFLQKIMNLPIGSVELLRGHQSRLKLLRIDSEVDPFPNLEELSK